MVSEMSDMKVDLVLINSFCTMLRGGYFGYDLVSTYSVHSFMCQTSLVEKDIACILLRQMVGFNDLIPFFKWCKHIFPYFVMFNEKMENGISWREYIVNLKEIYNFTIEGVVSTNSPVSVMVQIVQ